MQADGRIINAVAINASPHIIAPCSRGLRCRHKDFQINSIPLGRGAISHQEVINWRHRTSIGNGICDDHSPKDEKVDVDIIVQLLMSPCHHVNEGDATSKGWKEREFPVTSFVGNVARNMLYDY